MRSGRPWVGRRGKFGVISIDARWSPQRKMQARMSGDVVRTLRFFFVWLFELSSVRYVLFWWSFFPFRFVSLRCVAFFFGFGSV